jgi:hypothetical protein
MNIPILILFGIFVTRASVAGNPAAKIGFRPLRPSNYASEGFRASASINDAIRRTGEEEACP